MTPIQWARYYAKSAINGFETLELEDAIDNALSDLDAILRRLDGADDALSVLFVEAVKLGRGNERFVCLPQTPDLTDFEVTRLVGVHRLARVGDLSARDADLVLRAVIDRCRLERPVGDIVFVLQSDQPAFINGLTQEALVGEIARGRVFLGFRPATEEAVSARLPGHFAPSESQVAATGNHTADRGGAGSI